MMTLIAAALVALAAGPGDGRPQDRSLPVDLEVDASFAFTTFEGTLLAGPGVTLSARLDLSPGWMLSAGFGQQRVSGEDDKKLDPTLDPLCPFLNPLGVFDLNDPCWSARTHQIRHDSLDRTDFILRLSRRLSQNPTQWGEASLSVGAARYVGKRYEDFVHDGILVSHQEYVTRGWTIPAALGLSGHWNALPWLEIQAGMRMEGAPMTGFRGADRGTFSFLLDLGVAARF